MLNCDRNAEECSVPELVRGNQIFVVRLAMAHNDFAADRRLLTPARYERWTASWVTRQRRQEKVAWGRGGGVGVRSAATAIRTRCDATCVMVRCSITRCVHTALHKRGVTHSLTVGSRGSGQNIQQLCCSVRVSWFFFGLPQPSEEKCHVITTTPGTHVTSS